MRCGSAITSWSGAASTTSMHPGRAVKARPLKRLSVAESLRRHWPEYLMEAAQLGIFMVSAGAFTVLMESPLSFIGRLHLAPYVCRAVIGVAMGGTAMGLIYSPWGRRSGAHMNPAITMTFLRLGKIPPWDAFYYVIFQFSGGLAGVLLTIWTFGSAFTQQPVNYVATIPGAAGDGAAFAGEITISFIIMAMIVYVSNKPAIARFTGVFAGLLIALFVEFEAPLSGFGMNPARTLASALPGAIWTGLWIYFTAVPLGMLLAAQCYLMVGKADSIHCCKLYHSLREPCIFCDRRVLPGFE
jgi:aquaporin Z